ncbi:MAG: DUF4062 domain-containing protein [Clostridiaceae bacterium]|nr:DUF4062 domain-containing protein [Clostridiaceae bacterium]
MKWENVSIFISSTFKDMHAERDYLLKRVFPELSQWCAARYLRLVEIDLRWGVTSADAYYKNTVDICLKNIDKCRPFFLCFLGQRRGWVPTPEEISNETLADYPGLLPYLGRNSVTEMEIKHALLQPMRRIVDGVEQIPLSSNSAVFFIRSSSYVSSLNAEQRRIYTNDAEPSPSAADKLHNDFILQVRNGGADVFDYDCHFYSELYSPELKTEGDNCAQGRLSDFNVNGTPLYRVVIDCLKSKIIQAFPDRADMREGLTKDDEIELQKQRLKAKLEGVITRKYDIDAISAYCSAPSGKPLYLCADAGYGKTTLLSLYFNSHAHNYVRSCMRFCRISTRSVKWMDVWQSILWEECIERVLHSDTLSQELPEILELLAAKGSTLIIIDGVDVLDEGLTVLSSLPSRLPANMRLILSFRSDPPAAKIALEHAVRTGAAAIYEVPPICADIEAPLIVNTYLKDYLKALDDEHIATICSNPAAKNPLFLKIILKELRVFGAFKLLSEELASFGDSPRSAFDKVLARLETDIAYSEIPQATFIPAFFGLLSKVRGSIETGELKAAIIHLLNCSDESVSDAMALNMRQMRAYLDTDGSHVSIAYDTLKEAAERKYAANESALHLSLAMALTESDPVECLYHLRMAHACAQIREATENIAFICRGIARRGSFAMQDELLACGELGNGEVVRCITEISAVLYGDPEAAPALLYKELSSDGLREQAKALCRAPFLRYEPIKAEPPTNRQDKSFRTVFSVEQHSQSFCVASLRRLVFLLKGETNIEIFDQLTGKFCSSFALEHEGRVKQILCLSSGKYLAAIEPNNVFNIYSIAIDDAGMILGVACIHTDECASVRFGGLCFFSHGEEFIWQRPDNTVFIFSPESGGVHTVQTQDARLCGYFGEYTVWKAGGSYVFKSQKGASFISDARINSCIQCEDKLFVAVEDKKLLVLDSDTLKEVETIETPEAITDLQTSASCILLTDRYGSIYELDPDGDISQYGRLSQTNEVIDTKARLMPLDNGILSFISEQRLAVISFKEATSGRIMLVGESDKGVRLMWMAPSGFSVLLPGSRPFTLPRPEHLGKNVSWFENLRFAWSEDTVAYECDVGVLRLLSDKSEYSVSLERLISALAFSERLDGFIAVTLDSQCYIISKDGVVMGQFAVIEGENHVHIMCDCAENGMAILTRRVRIRESTAISAVLEDILIMVNERGIIWQRRCPLAGRTVQKVIFDEESHHFYLVEAEHIEEISAQTGETVGDTPLDLSVFDTQSDIVIKDGQMFCVSTEGNSLLLLEIASGKQICRLPSQRRVTGLTPVNKGILLTEDDKKLYKVTVQ